jgi:hypothetical protein
VGELDIVLRHTATLQAIYFHSTVDDMKVTLKEFKSQVAELNLLSQVAQSEDEQNAMLDSREAQPFDGEWLRVYKAVEQFAKNSEFDTRVVDEIRELTFKKAHQNTGNGEIAGYVSDDFDLLSRAIAADYSDEWLDLLWAEYQTGMFPHGDLHG